MFTCNCPNQWTGTTCEDPAPFDGKDWLQLVGIAATAVLLFMVMSFLKDNVAKAEATKAENKRAVGRAIDFSDGPKGQSRLAGQKGKRKVLKESHYIDQTSKRKKRNLKF